MTTRDISYNGTNAQIREFKLTSMVKEPAIVTIAKRGSGKSWLIRSLLNHYKHLPGGVILCPTEEVDPFYSNFYPNAFIHFTYSSHMMENVIKRQKMIIAKAKQKLKEKKRLDPRIMLVMDDCLDEKGKWAKDKPIMNILFNGRHLFITYILAMQYPLGIGPSLRNNFDYIFLFANDMVAEQKKLHEYYVGMFPSFTSFQDVFTQLTVDHGIMVVVMRGVGTGKIEDKIFGIKQRKKNLLLLVTDSLIVLIKIILILNGKKTLVK